ncbi:protein brunelleschi isoform X2 [Anoplophora glabripennis]|uniref:protein brunelleschi isoform X2 n=1 Tax=Anoplophora glabripennis TaxID=217634 RepID=UPI000873535D|nr:protein brunelleschi isoform X2 [Anoplophora glabripennis]
MRSSVSYILSSSTSEPNMSHPDYEQYSHDHAALLVLVRHIGSQLKPKTFMKFFDRISKINNAKITDSTGQVRSILIRYVKEYPVENNDWGDFQTHRRLLGLISLGKYDSQQELNEVCRVHESLKVKYNTTLFDSICILFGPTKESVTPETDDSSNVDSDPKSEDTSEKFTTPNNFKARALFYDESSPCLDLETQLNEFINSLFWVLESKRLERSREKLERVSLLLAPFEKKDFVGLDMESRNNKKRCTGRMTKHLGDLCMQAGLLTESLSYYTQAAETLKSINDWLWLGAAYEGLSAASALVLYPDMQRTVPLQRNASLQEGSPRKSSQTPSTSALVNRKLVANTLTPEDILKRYREAIIHYSKYQNAGIIETEASFKAARIAVEQNHALQAASFLQNVVYINLALSEQEKIQRFETLADLYTQIGFQRKAALCLRLAATRYVSPQNPAPNWARCYALMLQSLPGHHLTLDPVEMRTSNQGWPALQIQLLQELVVAARRTGHSALATRHMTFLLQTMWPHLSPTEQKELAVQLQSLSAQCEGSPVPLVLDSGLVVPPANLTDIPVCVAFTPKDLQPHLRPRRIESLKQDTGPFLFTPIHFGGGSLERKQNKANSKMDFLWVENEVCEVQLKLTNPLPFEQKVSNMRLLTAGVVFESVPETVVLPPDVPTSITLSGWARESGELELSGYSTHALGVKSNCRLRHMPLSSNFPPFYKVEVVPSLPILEVITSLPQSASFSNFHDDNIVTSASISLYHGESTHCTVTLTNIGQVPIEMLEVEVNSILEPTLQDQIFKWDDEEVRCQLPIQPSKSATITLYLHAAANFLAPNVPVSPSIQHDMSSGVFSSMSASLPPGGSLPSRFNSSFRSSNSGQSSIAGGLTALFQQQSATSAIEGQLRLRYSGSSGLEADYCRICSVFFMVEMTPSLHVTNWDVLPAEISQFYLVVDIANLTSQEMELQYTSTKTMLIEGQESCRVPIPVDRCPLSKLSGLFEESKEFDTGRNVIDVNTICSEHITDLVDLRWSLLATDSKGVASLKGINLTASMLDIVRMSPLDWEVKVNGGIVNAQEEVTCEAGDCLALQMSIANSLEWALNQLTLSVQFYQDYENGTINDRMETRLAMAGATKKILPSLEPRVKANHDCNVIFFAPGLYKLDIQCSASESSACGTANLVQMGHVWKFTPPISIQVT